MRKEMIYKNLIKDFAIIFLSILIAIILALTGAINTLLSLTKGITMIASFIAGIFYVSIFTTAPALVLIIGLAKTNSLLLIATCSSLGALIGDIIIFKFIKDDFSQDLSEAISHSRIKKMLIILKNGPFRRLFGFLGTLVIVSPLPDELGLFLMGASKMEDYISMPLFFILNFFGILALTYAFKY